MAVNVEIYQQRRPVRAFDKGVLHAEWDRVTRVFNEEAARVLFPMQVGWRHLASQKEFHRLLDEPQPGQHIKTFLKARAAHLPVRGVMHDSQIKTIVAILQKIHNAIRLGKDPRVLVLGAMMCGKTGTCNGLQVIGPIFYIMTGIRFNPLVIGPPRKASHGQTQHEFGMWNALYGELRFVMRLQRNNVRDFSRRPVHREHCDEGGGMTFRHYRSCIMAETLDEFVENFYHEGRYKGDAFSILNQRRTPRSLPIVRELCKTAEQNGLVVAFISDEPHWGSEVGGIQDQMLATVRNMQNHALICLDATPFEIANAGKFDVVRHRLGDGYCGPNCWDGSPFDPDAETQDVNLNTLGEFATNRNISDFSMFNRKAYNSIQGFRSWLTKWNIEHRSRPLKLTHTQYRTRVEMALGSVLTSVLITGKHPDTRGANLRLFADGPTTKQVIAKLNLDPRIKIIWYMSKIGQDQVEYVINKYAPTGPYLVVVTGAARMADFYPQDCTHFFDFTEKVTSMYALLQGSYGRACGYGAPRWVIMPEQPIMKLRKYLDTNGLDVSLPLGNRASMPHAALAQPYLINAHLKIEIVAVDPIMKKVFSDLQKTVVDQVPFGDGTDLPAMRRSFNERFVPFWGIFTETILRHIESNSRQLLPDLAEIPHLLRPGVSQRSKRGQPLTIPMHKNHVKAQQGFGKIGLRNSSIFQGGDANMKGKANKGTENTGGARLGEAIPQLWLAPDHLRKRWKLVEIVMRLDKAVRPVVVHDDDDARIYATANSAFWTDHLPEAQAVVNSRIISQNRRKRK